jgi:hypothetical protein
MESLLYNLALRQTLVYWTRAGPEASEARIGGVLTFQISADFEDEHDVCIASVEGLL